ncbi:hypothetical protein IW261DRAFT_1426293 [Armillaria novae-zelandiae]|uniref:Uncharacterized protein n=1 Tax=Armillaria novae-zelandiae TaxID=153914 RepID=A0AA39TWM0_9AGAR|nr:hypothetical protein IW261DRAFT_1426293 [Armillaria novae-zelandiae]
MPAMNRPKGPDRIYRLSTTLWLRSRERDDGEGVARKGISTKDGREYMRRKRVKSFFSTWPSLAITIFMVCYSAIGVTKSLWKDPVTQKRIIYFSALFSTLLLSLCSTELLLLHVDAHHLELEDELPKFHAGIIKFFVFLILRSLGAVLGLALGNIVMKDTDLANENRNGQSLTEMSADFVES